MASPFGTPCIELRAERAARAVRTQDWIRTSRLAGNVGLLRLAGGARDESRPLDPAAVVAALRELSASDALIIDLRESHELDMALAALVSSLLFDTASALTREAYVEPGTRLCVEPVHAPARYLDKPVLVVLGPESGVVAAALARNLKRLRRAIVVGESPRAARVAANVPAPAGRAGKVAHLVALSTLQQRRMSSAPAFVLQAAIVAVRRELEQLRVREARHRAAS